MNLANRCFRKWERLVARARGWKEVAVFGETLRFQVGSRVFEGEFRRYPRETVSTDYVLFVDYVQLRSVVHAVQALRRPPVFVDIGAYHGEYAVLVGKLVQPKGGKVLAIEPDESNFDILKNNVSMNSLGDTVVCERVAVTDANGVCGWKSDGSQSAVSGLSAMKQSISTLRLDEILRRHSIDRVDILMIDVEGAELLVLRGAPEWTGGAPKIFCEMHPYAWKDHGYTGEDLSAYLRNRGLVCVDMFFRERKSFDDEKHYIGPTVLIET